MIHKVLSIAGFDPSGGAGVAADIKTLGALGVYGMGVITALTVQNTRGVYGVEAVDAGFVRAQLLALFDDVAVHGVKIGMIADVGIVHVIADVLEEFKPPNIVLDPVMVASSGANLMSEEALEALKGRLIPLVDVLTPNIPEAEKLSRKAVLDMEVSARGLLSLGSRAVLLKGGHLKGAQSVDVLARTGVDALETYSAARILTASTHGTGCAFSSALAAFLARGDGLPAACAAAKAYVGGAIAAGGRLGVGHGHGPVHHFWDMWDE